MSLKKIPKVNPPHSQFIPKQVTGGNSKIVFSFEHLDFNNPYYNCNGMCDKGIKNCFEKLREYCKFTVDQIHAGLGGRAIRFHNINQDDVDEWPEYISRNEQLANSFYQISFGKTKGRAHGVIIENIFYIIWLDPHHFLYHNKSYGPKIPFRPIDSCCNPRDEVINEYETKIKSLEKENKELYVLIDEATS